LNAKPITVAMFSLHSSPIGALGSRDTGGMSVYIRELAEELGRRGHRIDIFTHQNSNTRAPVVDLDKNIRLIHLDNGRAEPVAKPVAKLDHYYCLADYFSSLETFQKRDGLHYDVIHSHYWLSGLLGQIARDRWRIPHIVMFHTLGALKNMAGAGAPEPKFRITNEKRLVQTCQGIVAATPRERDSLIRFYDAEEEKIQVVPCGVNLGRFRPLSRLTARRQLGFNADESILLYVGRFVPEKGLDRLIEALTHLRGHPRLRLVIIGGDGANSAAYQDLQRLIHQFDVKERVTLAGQVEQSALPSYYCAANMLVIPSRYESFGLTGLESLACGTPVVSTPVGAIEDVQDKGQAGVVISEGTPAALAGSIEIFLPGGLAGAPVPEVVRASVLGFSWSHVAEAMIDQYTNSIIN